MWIPINLHLPLESWEGSTPSIKCIELPLPWRFIHLPAIYNDQFPPGKVTFQVRESGPQNGMATFRLKVYDKLPQT